MKRSLLLALATLALPALAHAQTGYTITGAMSNFDCSNHCDYDCDELEVDIDGVQPEDVIHTYHNANYGAPTVTLSADGTYTIVDYRNPAHTTAVNSIEHFGVTLRGAIYYGPQPYHPTRVRWFKNGHPATVNGLVPSTGAGGSAPATQPLQPTITAGITSGSHGQGGVSLTVKNNDTTQAIWVIRRVQITTDPVTLEDLMPTNPVVTTSLVIDPTPAFIAPGQTLALLNDFFEVESEQNAVFSAQYFQNLTGGGPFAQNTPGPELGNVMTATTADPRLACAHSIPTVDSQPASVTADLNARVDLRVSGRGDDLSPLQYIWMHDGVPLTDGNGISGSTSNHLRIDHLTPGAEGFYNVRLTNVCATILSNSALVFITGHNSAPVHTGTCAGDFNYVGGATSQDIFDFLAAWFATIPSADFNQSGAVTVQDIFDFLSAWFVGCP